MWQEEEEVPKVVNVKVKLGRKERRISRKLSALNLAPWGSKRKLNMLSNQRRSQCQHNPPFFALELACVDATVTANMYLPDTYFI